MMGQPKPVTYQHKVGILLPTLFLLLRMTTPTQGQALTDSLQAYLTHLPSAARVSIAVQSLGHPNQQFSHRANERVPSASVIKLPIMLEVMERVKAGQLNLDKVHTLLASEKVGGSGLLQNYPDQSPVSYRELLRLMMVASDNTATNIFIQLLGRDAINQRIRTIGLTQSQLNRIMMDTLAAKQGRENYVTAQEMNQLLTKIYRHQVATPALCNQMIEILKQNTDRVTIPRLLPQSVVVAHKTGTLAYVRGDAGIVYAREPFVLSVMVEGIPTPEAEQIIGEIALICYQHFSHP